MQWPQKVVNKLKPHLQIHEWLIKQNTTKQVSFILTKHSTLSKTFHDKIC